jgi:hypothetical protein
MNTSKIEKSSKKIPWLAGLFSIQVALAVVLFNVQGGEPDALNEPLLAVDSAALDRIEIHSADGSIELQKKDGQWQMGDGLPVADGRISDLLKQLEALRRGWAVATTDEAAKRFEVTEETFKRKIRLLQGDTEVDTLLVGTSPSFRQSHVRKPGDDEIYSVKLDEFSLATDRDNWLDTQLMRPKGDIVALQFGDRSVKKVAGQWPANTPESVAATQSSEASGEPVNEAEAASETAGEPPKPRFDSAAFAKALTDLTVLGLADNQAELDAPVTEDATQQNEEQVLKIQWEITTSDGHYQYQLLSRNDQYYIRRDDNDHTFRLSKAQYDALAKIQELRQS